MTLNNEATEAACNDLRTSLRAKQARFPWIGPHLQTLRNTLLSPRVDLSPWPAQELRMSFSDGDETLCYAHKPLDHHRKRSGCAVLVHGLGGDASGAAIQYLSAALLSAGWPVVRVNLRAAPMVSHLARSISHAGKTEDLRDIFSGLEDALGQQRWLALGISLGGNMLAKALGDGALTSFDIAAAMTICAPIDMKTASDKILEPRNTLYARHLLKDLQAAVAKSGMDSRWQEAAQNAGSVYAFDDKVTGPFHGFGDAETYYAGSSAAPYLKDITVPTLLLTAGDDPWIPVKMYHTNSNASGRAARIIIAPKGGHVGFHFKGDQCPAYCAVAVDWFTAAAN